MTFPIVAHDTITASYGSNFRTLANAIKARHLAVMDNGLAPQANANSSSPRKYFSQTIVWNGNYIYSEALAGLVGSDTIYECMAIFRGMPIVVGYSAGNFVFQSGPNSVNTVYGVNYIPVDGETIKVYCSAYDTEGDLYRSDNLPADTYVFRGILDTAIELFRASDGRILKTSIRAMRDIAAIMGTAAYTSSYHGIPAGKYWEIGVLDSGDVNINTYLFFKNDICAVPENSAAASYYNRTYTPAIDDPIPSNLYTDKSMLPLSATIHKVAKVIKTVHYRTSYSRSWSYNAATENLTFTLSHSDIYSVTNVTVEGDSVGYSSVGNVVTVGVAPVDMTDGDEIIIFYVYNTYNYLCQGFIWNSTGADTIDKWANVVYAWTSTPLRYSGRKRIKRVNYTYSASNKYQIAKSSSQGIYSSLEGVYVNNDKLEAGEYSISSSYLVTITRPTTYGDTIRINYWAYGIYYPASYATKFASGDPGDIVYAEHVNELRTIINVASDFGIDNTATSYFVGGGSGLRWSGSASANTCAEAQSAALAIFTDTDVNPTGASMTDISPSIDASTGYSQRDIFSWKNAYIWYDAGDPVPDPPETPEVGGGGYHSGWFYAGSVYYPGPNAFQARYVAYTWGYGINWATSLVDTIAYGSMGAITYGWNCQGNGLSISMNGIFKGLGGDTIGGTVSTSDPDYATSTFSIPATLDQVSEVDIGAPPMPSAEHFISFKLDYTGFGVCPTPSSPPVRYSPTWNGSAWVPALVGDPNWYHSDENAVNNAGSVRYLTAQEVTNGEGDYSGIKAIISGFSPTFSLI